MRRPVVDAVVRAAHPRRRRTPARGARERRHSRGRRPRAALRRGRASACVAPSTCSSASGGELVEDLVLAARRVRAQRGTRGDTPLQRGDFVEILDAMGGARDHPAHRPSAARVPARPDRAVGARRAAEAERGTADRQVAPAAGSRSPCTSRTRCSGLRGVRLGLVVPGPVRDAGAGRARGRGRPVERGRIRARRSWSPWSPRSRSSRSCAMSSSEVAARSTRSVGSSYIPGRHHDRATTRRADRGQDRAEARLLLLRHQRPHPDDVGILARRRRGGVLPGVPHPGVFAGRRSRPSTSTASGALVATAVERGSRARPDLHVGVCGEHGGDPDSIHFFESVGLDYVSCSPFRIPVARLEAARAVL